MWNRLVVGVWVVFLGMVCGGGCGEGGEKGRVVLVGGGFVGDVAVVGDVGEVLGEVGVGGVEDVGEVLGVGSRCGGAVDLGMLGAGDVVEGEVVVEGEESWLEVGCGVDGSGAEGVFRLEVGGPMRLRFEVLGAAGFDGVMELRAGDCGGEVVFCSDGEVRDLVVEAGVYFLVVEGKHGGEVGALGVRVEAVAAGCAPAGQWRCEGASRVQCFGGFEERGFACAGGCGEGFCGGDRCEDALVVRESGTFVGETGGYGNGFDFSGEESCSGSGTVGMRTVGQDVVFFLPGLRAGQEVFVDALTGDTNDNVIAVLDSCSVLGGCVAAASSGDQLRWEVGADGDYYVVIDKTTATARAFHYRIEINP